MAAKSFFTNEKAFEQSKKVAKDFTQTADEAQSAFKEIVDQKVSQITSQKPSVGAEGPSEIPKPKTVKPPIDKQFQGDLSNFADINSEASEYAPDEQMEGLSEIEKVQKNEPPAGLGPPSSVDIKGAADQTTGALDSISTEASDLTEGTMNKVKDAAGKFGNQIRDVTAGQIGNLQQMAGDKQGLIQKIGDLCEHADIQALLDKDLSKFIPDIPELQTNLDLALSLGQSELLRQILNCYQLKKKSFQDIGKKIGVPSKIQNLSPELDVPGADFNLDVMSKLKSEAKKGNPETTGILAGFTEANGEPIDRLSLAKDLTNNITNDERTKEKTKEALSGQEINPPETYVAEFGANSTSVRIYPNHIGLFDIYPCTYFAGLDFIEVSDPDTTEFEFLEVGDIIKTTDGEADIEGAEIKGLDKVNGAGRIYLSKQPSRNESDITVTFMDISNAASLDKIHEGQYIKNAGGAGLPEPGKEIRMVEPWKEFVIAHLEEPTEYSSSAQPASYDIGVPSPKPLNTDISKSIENQVPDPDPSPGSNERVLDINKAGSIHTQSDILEDPEVYGKGDDAKIAQTMMLA